MSLQRSSIPQVPPETVLVAKAAFPSGNVYMQMRDELGNIYISNNFGVTVIDPNGNHILTIPTGVGATNNTFAGRDGKVLFITDGAGTVTGIKMSVKGVPGL